MKKFLCLLVLFSLSLFGGEFSLSNLVKSNGQIKIEEYLKDIDFLIDEFREKLNKRNPFGYDKKSASLIKSALLSHKKIVLRSSFSNSVEVLRYALDREHNVKYRNDYLIIGLHDMIYEAFERDEFKFTALSYDVNRLNKLYKNLQILFWQINTYKDKNGDYLFLTWQNEWQLALQKRLQNGESFKKAVSSLDKEELFKPCNMSFSMIYAKILYIVGKIIKQSGGEPTEIGVNVIKSIALSPLF